MLGCVSCPYRKGNVPRRCTGRAFRPVPRTPFDRVAIQRSRTFRSTLFFFLGPSRWPWPTTFTRSAFFFTNRSSCGVGKISTTADGRKLHPFFAATTTFCCCNCRYLLLRPACFFFYILFLLSISCPNKKSCNRLHESFNPTFKKLQPINFFAGTNYCICR